MQNKIIFTLILVVIGVIIGGFYMLAQPDIATPEDADPLTLKPGLGTTATSTATSTEDMEEGAEQHVEVNKTVEKNFIYIGKKNPGKDINIDVVSTKQGGFVVVYENTFEPTGELLAVSEYLNSGEYFRVPIQLLREVEDGEVFTAMLHADDGDKFFNISNDVPIRDKAGEGVYTELIIEDLMPVDETKDQDTGENKSGDNNTGNENNDGS